jgi:hypothetical protein
MSRQIAVKIMVTRKTGQFLLAVNRGIGWVQVKILTPILLTLLWILIGITCVIPRLLGVRLIQPFRRGGETHWTEHAPIDMSVRRLKRQG